QRGALRARPDDRRKSQEEVIPPLSVALADSIAGSHLFNNELLIPHPSGSVCALARFADECRREVRVEQGQVDCCGGVQRTTFTCCRGRNALLTTFNHLLSQSTANTR